MTEDEKTPSEVEAVVFDLALSALEWAKRTVDAWEASGREMWSDRQVGALALLDAVRLILEPFEGECRFCLFPVPHHAEDCPALPWVLAAERAGTDASPIRLCPLCGVGLD